ncbi:hypothetical protein [Salinicoccus sp. HZC-1]|uniref:hypothetical protein n=1 Tax=Salinicoccus sp. HZC-1 TaxID=3385497 RepID=UPI00398AAC2F
MKEKKIFETILLERERQDRDMIRLEFNVHTDVVVMNYIYEEPAGDEDVHKQRHNHDPELLDEETFEALKKKLYEHNIPFKQRRDEFI